MKVLHVIPSVAPIRGGPSLAVVEMVKALRDCGIEAEIATTNDNGCEELDVPLRQCIEYKNAPVWFFQRFSPTLHALREFAFSSQLTTWLWQNIHNYDLLHLHAIFSYPSTVAMTIARYKQIPYIVRPLGQLCLWSLQQSARKKQIYLNLIERTNLNHSQALHLTSQQEQQELDQLGLSTSNFILPHGLSIPPTIKDARYHLRQHLNIPLDEPIILFLSRLHPKKGLDYLIPALGKLTNCRFTFVIAGSGTTDYEAEIISLLVSHGIRERTHLTGFVTGDLKHLLLQGADLFTLTSHSENFGVAVLEALAAAIPVVVTPGVALASVVQQHQLGYVTELNVSAIASTLQQVLDHLPEAKTLSSRAQKFVLDTYSWENIVSQMLPLYNDIINQHSGNKK